MNEILGWLMTFCFVVCGIPQAYKCYKDGNGKGLSVSFILLWLFGEILGLLYSLGIKPFQIPLFVNYLLSGLITVIILKYIWFPRNGKRTSFRKSWKRPR